ncbi:MAG: sodium:solute symporter family protein [Bacteroidota bacterium]|nr:sodium:solute symporter family protein [Bacteroidota bacterium]
MNIELIDWIIIIFCLLITLLIGFIVSKNSAKNTSQFFLSGRNMPWWLLGISMVATTFSTDTPNLVTDIVRNNGVAGNWVWWVFLLTGLLTVFVYAKLWRRSNIRTDMEFYKIRYSGKPAHFLRKFRALYLGLIFNVLAMAGISLAAIKIGQVMLGLTAYETIGIASVITVIFSAVGGFKGVIYTDLLLFVLAMFGSIYACIYLINIPQVGGLESLLTHPNVSDKLSLFPNLNNKEDLIILFIIPLTVQWWSSWYPGAEPGGGGYIAQRMLAAKDEKHAIKATFFFNIMHYALRPWPWILIALASLIVFPDLASLEQAFPEVSKNKIGHDLAYSAMLTKLPTGLIGLVLASLIAAYMSTISTHLNWGASYLVHDFYQQQINPDASEKELIFIARLITVILMILSASTALVLTNALQLFDFILMFGAGTGLIFILRWFWWRINAWSEITAMLVSGIVSIIFSINYVAEFLFGIQGLMPAYMKFPVIVLITTFFWILVMYLTPPDNNDTLLNFYKKVNPGGPGWDIIVNNNNLKKSKWSLPSGLFLMTLAIFIIYCLLFATGSFIYGNYFIGTVLLVIVIVTSCLLKKKWDT